MKDYTDQRFGNYRLIARLGAGGFAQIYLGEQLYLKTRAAIKVLDVPLEDEHIEQFRLEAATVAHLDHPHIVRLLDYGVEHTIPYLVMDYAPGGTLRQRHPSGVTVPLARIVRYIQQVAGALEYAHQQNVIHRDVKPENLLLGRKHEVLLSDFGIAVVAQGTEPLTNQEPLGTASYIAPEQLRGRPHPASDQYALAVVAYEWLTGNTPFYGSQFEVVRQHLETPPPPLRQPGSSIPVEVERVVLKALEKEWQQRFASVREFAIALHEAATASPHVVSGSGSDLPGAPAALADPLDLAPTGVLTPQGRRGLNDNLPVAPATQADPLHLAPAAPLPMPLSTPAIFEKASRGRSEQAAHQDERPRTIQWMLGWLRRRAEQADDQDERPLTAPTALLAPAAHQDERPLTAPTALLAPAAQKDEGLSGNPAVGDPRGERVIDPAPRPTGQNPSPHVRRARRHRLNRRKAWFAAAALLIMAMLGVGSLLLAQGSMTAGVVASGLAAAQTQGVQHAATATPGNSAPSPGKSGTTSAPSTASPPPGATPTSAPSGGVSPTATPTPPHLSVSPTSLTFSLQLLSCLTSNHSQTLTVQNTGGGALSWQATIQNSTYLSLDSYSGTLGPSRTSQITVTLICPSSALMTTDSITFSSNGGTVIVSVTISVL